MTGWRKPPANSRALPTEADLTPIADAVLALGGFAVIGELVLIADVIVVEQLANGDDPPGAHRLERADGRSVYVFRRPLAWPTDRPS